MPPSPPRESKLRRYNPFLSVLGQFEAVSFVSKAAAPKQTLKFHSGIVECTPVATSASILSL